MTNKIKITPVTATTIFRPTDERWKAAILLTRNAAGSGRVLPYGRAWECQAMKGSDLGVWLWHLQASKFWQPVLSMRRGSPGNSGAPVHLIRTRQPVAAGKQQLANV